MKGEKINSQNLDQVVGGVIQEGTASIFLDGDNVTAVKGDEKTVMSVEIFKDLLSDAGVSQENSSKFIAMMQSDNNYNFDQVKNETGIDLNKDI